MVNWNAIDSIIFDMDGTLWDATESYSTVWNICSDKLGIDKKISRDELLGYMGKPIDVIFNEIFADDKTVNTDEYISLLDVTEDKMMPILGGIPYDTMAQNIAKLAKHYKLFLISNCGKNGLNIFMKYTGITHYITDTLTFGATLKPKSDNIKHLIAKHNLSATTYMGDTQGDCDETHRANIPFIYASYGFGKCSNPEITFDSFNEFASYFLKLKSEV
ncbi:MAG: HAD family hydrolase [Muribaculaceae bacterium]